MNRLFFGDNLEVLRDLPPESVDLIYLDPPFNSDENYSVIFNRHDVHADVSAQIQAFNDTWVWDQHTDLAYSNYVAGGVPEPVADALAAFRIILGENNAMAYLVNMAPRLVELHRVLKSTGSFYLHCDPTMSHYIKILLDAIFDARFFKSEIIWKRTSAHNSAKRWGPVHDVILFYTKSDRYTWNRVLQPNSPEYLDSWYKNAEPDGRRYQVADLTAPGPRTGESGAVWRGIDVTAKNRHWAIPGFVGEIVAGMGTIEALETLDTADRLAWPKKPGGVPRVKRYLDEAAGVAAQDVITDIPPLVKGAEKLGYPTQKPLALLERIISVSSNPGDVVLDPFAGCGTSIDAAQRLGRQWIGIDITYIAIDLITKRLVHTYGASVMDFVEVSGLPRDTGGAEALFERDPFEFERWAVSLIDARPNDKQVGDKGIDGIGRFVLPSSKSGFGRVVASVKGGKSVNPAMVRDLIGTVNSHQYELGVLITLRTPTAGMIDAANKSGSWTHPANNQVYPRVQIITVSDLLAGRKPEIPPIVLPYVKAKRQHESAKQALSVQGELV